MSPFLLTDELVLDCHHLVAAGCIDGTNEFDGVVALGIVLHIEDRVVETVLRFSSVQARTEAMRQLQQILEHMDTHEVPPSTNENDLLSSL